MLTARPTTYRGIDMRSRLEARFATFLDTVGAEWIYEPRAYAAMRGMYLPDFEITKLEEPVSHPTFVECKPRVEDAEEAMARMEIIWDSVPDARLMVWVDDIQACLYTDESRRWEFHFRWTV